MVRRAGRSKGEAARGNPPRLATRLSRRRAADARQRRRVGHRPSVGMAVDRRAGIALRDDCRLGRGVVRGVDANTRVAGAVDTDAGSAHAVDARARIDRGRNVDDRDAAGPEQPDVVLADDRTPGVRLPMMSVVPDAAFVASRTTSPSTPAGSRGPGDGRTEASAPPSAPTRIARRERGETVSMAIGCSLPNPTWRARRPTAPQYRGAAVASRLRLTMGVRRRDCDDSARLAASRARHAGAAVSSPVVLPVSTRMPRTGADGRSEIRGRSSPTIAPSGSAGAHPVLSWIRRQLRAKRFEGLAKHERRRLAGDQRLPPRANSSPATTARRRA